MSSTFNQVIKPSKNAAIVIPESGLEFSYEQLIRSINFLQSIFTNTKSPLCKSLQASTKDFNAYAISLPNSLEFVVSFLAVTSLGLVAAPLNYNYKSSEFDFYLEDLQTDAIFVPKGFRTKLINSSQHPEIIKSAKGFDIFVVEVWFDESTNLIKFAIFDFKSETALFTSDDVLQSDRSKSKIEGGAKSNNIALILHTSGTTGRPKAVPLTHKNIVTSMKKLASIYDLSPNDTTYVVMPLFHVHGMIGALFSTLYSGGTAVIPNKFSARVFWDHFTNYKATWYSAVPTIHQILLKLPIPEQPLNIRFIRSCSSALAPATLFQLEEKFKAPVIEAMGMTECAHCVTSNNLPQFGKHKPGTVGQPPNGVQIVILDDNDKIIQGTGKIGQVSVKGENVTAAYLNNPKANKENFTDNNFFKTGDQGYFDKDNFLVLVGRIKELINRGGEKISPIELDNILLTNRSIQEAVAFGVKDEKYGQIVHAAVVVKPGCNVTSADLKKFMLTRVATFKIPVKFYFVDALPKTATGKIQRRKMEGFFAKTNHKL